MAIGFEELDYQETPLGPVSLRRRADPLLGGQILYEVKLGDEFLMSSLFTEAEVQLARLALDSLAGMDLDVVVGGLGLGYTAAAALESSAIRSLRVIEVMEAVIGWHRQGLVPLGKTLLADPRCILVHADFFEKAFAATGFIGEAPSQLVHAVLLDIDHSPSHWLNPQNGSFYTKEGLTSLADKLHPGGVFGLWSNDPPDESFCLLLEAVFGTAASHVVTFPNPYSGGVSTNTVYLAHRQT